MLPVSKSFVEELFAEALVKVGIRIGVRIAGCSFLCQCTAQQRNFCVFVSLLQYRNNNAVR